MVFEEIDVEIRNRALREALKKFPRNKMTAVLNDCGLTPDEKAALMEQKDGADLLWIAGKLNTSKSTVDRLRASAITKLRIELNM
jgi:hypothetical protein